MKSLWQRFVLPLQQSIADSRLSSRLTDRVLPRIALVKQDCNEDLYCCEPGLPVHATIESTLLRPGPVALFTKLGATFLMLRTEPDPECSIWREKSEVLHWAPIEWFECFKEHVPGRPYGQSQFARSASTVDWSVFDLVVSIDCAVPSRITNRFPATVWAYYVREIKTPAFARSMIVPLPGQDLFLSQDFSMSQPRSPAHVVHFPYHFHYCGWHQELWPQEVRAERCGVFVDFHSAREASLEQLHRLEEFGPVFAHTAADDIFDPASGLPVPSVTARDPARGALLSSKFHVNWCGRGTFGTARVEAVAAGCLALAGTGPRNGAQVLQSSRTSAQDFEELIEKLRVLDRCDRLYRAELDAQRQLVDYLCYYRPAVALLRAYDGVRMKKARNPRDQRVVAVER